MDPVIILGLISNATSIVKLCITTSKDINDLYSRQHEAHQSPLTIEQECATIQAAVEIIRAWASTAAGRSRKDQCAALDKALQLFIPSMKKLTQVTERILRNTTADGSLMIKGRIKYPWRETQIKSYLGEVRGQAQQLHLLVSTINL